MRMKVLQALAAGKAVVTTTRGAEGIELAPPAPLLVADDVDDTAAAVAGLLADRGARAELGTRARAYAARRHSPEAYAERLEQSYDEAARRAQSRLAERPMSGPRSLFLFSDATAFRGSGGCTAPAP